MSQLHFDPATYQDFIRQEIPQYDFLQDSIAQASSSVVAASVLDLGSGTGETLARVLARHPSARVIGMDESDGMLEVARRRLEEYDVTLRVADLLDELPPGPFDLVVSALAVHHLDGPDKADLFARIARVLRHGGRFVLADVVIPLDHVDAVVPVTDGYDRPSTLADQLHWLSDAGFDEATAWSEHDLVVVRADRPG